MEDHKELTRRESRKEMRKESRLLKRKNRFLSWVQHKNNGKMKASDLEEPPHKELPKEDPDLLDDPAAIIEPVKNRKRKASVKPSKKTKFQEYLDLEITKDKDDLEMERKLARKLKVRGGKLGGVDDGLNDFLGIISMQEDADEISSGEKERNNAKHTSSLRKKREKKRCTPGKETQPVEQGDDPGNEEKELAVEAAEQLNVSEKNLPKEEINAKCAKYMAPHLRTCSRAESEELVQFRRRVRGLLNRLSESNVEPITEEIAAIFRTISRSDGCRIIGEAVMSSCVNGPRGSEQHTSVFAAFVAGMACLVGIDFSAKLIASLAVAYENEYVKEDNLSLRNITLLLSYLCIFGVCSSDLIYDFLSILSKRMTESDTSTILAVLQCCGMRLRSDDPTAMKNFILNIQNRVSELKCPSGFDAQPKINNKRMEFMLETICDIKNNKRREKEDPVHHTRIKKWLQKLKAEDMLLRGLKWSKLLDPEKKGQWWLFGEITCTDDTIEDVAVRIDKEVLEAQKLIQLASEHRMNTDLRRAIFCVIMSGEDYLDAFEKILRLDLSGKQDREIMRVLVKCCLQEEMFNKYYIFLASKLCSHDKNHKFTLQFCLWDHYKTLDSMPPHSSVNLAKFVAEMSSSFTLSLALLKSVDLTNPEQLTPNRIQHFRMLFEAIFEKTDAVIWNMFTRVAALPEREVLGQSLEFFIKRFVITHDPEKSFAAKFRIAKKALNNVAGVLM